MSKWPEGYGATGGSGFTEPDSDDIWVRRWSVGSDRDRVPMIGTEDEARNVAWLMHQRDEARSEVAKLKAKLADTERKLGETRDIVIASERGRNVDRAAREEADRRTDIAVQLLTWTAYAKYQEMVGDGVE